MDLWLTVMRVRIPRVCAVLISMLSLSSMAGELQASGVGKLEVRDVDPASLLFTVSDVANLNLIAVAPAGERRTSLSIDFLSVAELFEKLTAKLNVHVAKAGHIAVLTPCGSRGLHDSLATERGQLSIRLQDVSLEELFDVPELKAFKPDTLPVPLAGKRVMVQVRHVSPKETVAALSLAFDASVAEDGDARFRIGAGCQALGSEPRSHRYLQQRLLRSRSNHCPYQAERSEPNARPCSPLEFFNLTVLRPRGYIEWNGNRLAFVEAPDGILYVAKRGAYIGRNVGQVVAISREAIQLQEIIQDEREEWQEVGVELRYGAAPQPSKAQPLDYLQSASPQYNYNKAVNDLFLLKERALGISELCRTHHPGSSSAVGEALDAWRNQYARELDVISRHSDAYAERAAEDVGVSRRVVYRNAHLYATEKIDEFFRGIGGVDSVAGEAYCRRWDEELKGTAFDLRNQFADEFKLLSACREMSTCLNLDDDLASRK